MTDAPAFAIFYAGDAYHTHHRIMGRQAAGEAFLRGVARTWPQARIRGCGTDARGAQRMHQQLRREGFSGEVRWCTLPDWQVAAEAGALYYPAPPTRAFAAARNLTDPAAFSLMGVTHTLCSAVVMDQIAELILPPFKPWDALICTSQAARTLVAGLQDEMRDYWREHTGATHFTDVQLPVIPLGVDLPGFAPRPGGRAAARAALGLGENEVAVLFAGRLSFHAKAHPVPFYQALEKVAGERSIVCIEAGVFPNEAIKQGYLAAQRALAPSVRFITVDGKCQTRYRQTWQAADLFVSLADNIQESFGLTPVEAMAAGLPVIVSDWSGYKDTVRDGVDGLRIASVMPPPGAGEDLALRHALQLDAYDYYVGRTALATVVDPQAFATALSRLAGDPLERRRMGAAGRARAEAEFDWPAILRRYADLAGQLGEVRRQAISQPAQRWVQRADPYRRFAHFPSATLAGDWPVRAQPDAQGRLETLLSLAMANYALDPALLPREALPALLAALQGGQVQTVNTVLASAGLATQIGVRALMWLWKFDLVEIRTMS